MFAPLSLQGALDRLGFVQADPIRCPARAQDLILRHRVKGYQAGDLEQAYPQMDLEECYLYAYGFSSPALWQAIYPKRKRPLTPEERQALSHIQHHGPTHPKTLDEMLGGERRKNVWGGVSRTAKLLLESLHSIGAVRVAHREQGIRVYEAAKDFQQNQSPKARFSKLLITTLKAMGPMTRSFLLKELAHFSYLITSRQEREDALQALVESGVIRRDTLDQVEYLSLQENTPSRRPRNKAYLLAPFDPLVRDRSRFEHLWGWRYRFEAYTPKAKRQLGYYAMPVLWQDEMVGWANARVVDEVLQVEIGYAGQVLSEPAFKEALHKEVQVLAEFLHLPRTSYELRL